MQRTPAGFPLGIPGIFDVIEGAIQHAPQDFRQSMDLHQTVERMNLHRITGFHAITISWQDY